MAEKEAESNELREQILALRAAADSKTYEILNLQVTNFLQLHLTAFGQLF